MLWNLIRVKLHTARGSMRAQGNSKTRGPFFIILCSMFCVMLFRSTAWLVRKSLQLEPIGELLVQKVLASTLLVFFGILVFSNIIAVFSTFYMSDDLDFLRSHPIPPNTLFVSRFVETLSISSWVLMLFGVPAFMGAGWAMQADMGYYLLLVATVLPFAAIPTTIGTLVALGLTNMLSANRFRDGISLFILFILGVVYALARAFKVEKLLNPESFDSLGEAIALLTPPKLSMLPSDWMMDVLGTFLFGTNDIPWLSIGLLWSTPAALFFLSSWLHRRFYLRGYTMVQEGRQGPSTITRLRDMMLKASSKRAGGLKTQLEKLGQKKGRVKSFGQLLRKDLTIFTRDASQWSNLLMVVALMSIYLINYKYFQNNSETPLIGELGLYFFNLAVCGFMVVALAGRFLYPAISLEGRSFWILLQAPISLHRLIASKWLAAVVPIVVIGQLMIWISNILVSQSPFMTILGSLIVLMHSLTVGAMAVGMGCLSPQFNNPNASSIASSFGATFFIIMSMLVVIFDMLLLLLPIKAILKFVRYGNDAPSAMVWIALGFGIVFPILISFASIHIGARALRKKL